MAKCKMSPQEFIQSAFSPRIATLCSPDAELVCRKNNLSFVEMLQPFCRLNIEAYLKDPVQNQSTAIHNLRLLIQDMNVKTPQPMLAKRMLGEAVGTTLGEHLTSLECSGYSLKVSSSTPWFECWRDMLLKVMPPVVSTNHVNPVDELERLSKEQHQLQHQPTSESQQKPKWFSPNILKFYVLIHDVSGGVEEKAERVFATVKSKYGAYACYLLQINSQSNAGASQNVAEGVPPDPWSQFLDVPCHMEMPNHLGGETQPLEEENNDSLTCLPSKVEEGDDPRMIGSIEELDGKMNHPLALHDEQSSPISSETEEIGQMQIPPQNLTRKTPSPVETVPWDNSNSKVPHGSCLTSDDTDRIRAFLQEFAVRALIPFVERQTRLLYDTVTNRKGLHHSLFSATKKWFGGTKPGIPGANNVVNTVYYTPESTKLQLRRLADMAFMFQLYDFAYQMFYSAKKDFTGDQAWLYMAGAMEMAALSLYMANSTNYPEHYMDSAIKCYLHTCRCPDLATRCVLLSVEILKARGQWGNAANQLIKLTWEEADDQRSALVLEQAAHCFLNQAPPLVRKYAFHIILAGHRFSKAGQRRHALRCYKLASQVYENRGWAFSEDHINYTIGHQNLSLHNTEEAIEAFAKTLRSDSLQSGPQQASFLREYIRAREQSKQEDELAELPVPVIEGQLTKVLVGAFDTEEEIEGATWASHVQFGHDESVNKSWAKLEELCVRVAQKSVPMLMKPTLHCLSENTLNSTPPTSVIHEPIFIEVVLKNPFRLPLVLRNLYPIWSFINDDPGGGETITNKNANYRKVVQTSEVAELQIDSQGMSKVELKLIPEEVGKLNMEGLGYTLSTDCLKIGATAPADIRGMQQLQVKGPRLNLTKEQKEKVVYGTDYRLQPTILPPLPKLKVLFHDLPNQLLSGEVHQVQMELKNVGVKPLSELYLACSQPDMIAVGSEPTERTCPYRARTTRCVAPGLVSKRVVKVPLPDDVLQPGENYTLPLWLQGPDKLGTTHFQLMFYYVDPGDTAKKKRYRLVRHRSSIEVVGSVQLSATLNRAASLVEEPSSRNETFILHLGVHNKTGVAGVKILQVSSLSSGLCLSSKGVDPGCVHFGPNQRSEYSLRATFHQNSQDQGMKHSSVSFSGEEEWDTSNSPCWDFYERKKWKIIPLQDDPPPPSPLDGVELDGPSPHDINVGKLNNCLKTDATILLLWKVDGKEVYGQHEVSLESLYGAANARSATKTEDNVVKFVNKESERPLDISPRWPDVSVMENLVKYSMIFKSPVRHDFTRKRLCYVPVQLVVHNCCDCDLKLMLEMPSKSNSVGSSLIFTPTSSLSYKWVGDTKCERSIGARDTLQMALRVCFYHAGTYSLAKFILGARPQLDDAPHSFYLQKSNLFDPVIIIHNAKT